MKYRENFNKDAMTEYEKVQNRNIIFKSRKAEDET